MRSHVLRAAKRLPVSAVAALIVLAMVIAVLFAVPGVAYADEATPERVVAQEPTPPSDTSTEASEVKEVADPEASVPSPTAVEPVTPDTKLKVEDPGVDPTPKEVNTDEPKVSDPEVPEVTPSQPETPVAAPSPEPVPTLETEPAIEKEVSAVAAVPALVPGTPLARVVNGVITPGVEEVYLAFDYVLTEGVASTEVSVVIYKGVFEFEEVVASDSTGIVTSSGRYARTFSLPAGTYTVSFPVEVYGSSPQSDRSYYFTVNASDPIVVTPQPPIQVGNEVTIPTQTGVIYTDGEGNVLTGTVTVPKGGLVVKAAPAADGYAFPPDATTDWQFLTVPPVVITAPKPPRVGDTVTIPVVEHVEYYNTDTNEPVSGTIPVPQSGFQIGARPSPGSDNVKVVGGPWVYVAPAPLLITPEPPIQVGNEVTIPSQTGVTYTDANGKTLTGTVVVPEEGLEVQAFPKKGYIFSRGAVTEWGFAYIPAPPSPEPQPVQPSPIAPVEPPIQAGPKEERVLAATGSDSAPIWSAGVVALILMLSGSTLLLRRRRA